MWVLFFFCFDRDGNSVVSVLLLEGLLWVFFLFFFHSCEVFCATLRSHIWCAATFCQFAALPTSSRCLQLLASAPSSLAQAAPWHSLIKHLWLLAPHLRPLVITPLAFEDALVGNPTRTLRLLSILVTCEQKKVLLFLSFRSGYNTTDSVTDLSVSSLWTYRSFLWTQTPSRRIPRTLKLSQAGLEAGRCPWVCLYILDCCEGTERNPHLVTSCSFWPQKNLIKHPTGLCVSNQFKNTAVRK